MIVISQALALSLAESGDSNNPVIGWQNLVAVGNVSSLTEADGYPISNVANPITSAGARWRAEASGDETIEVSIEEVDEIDYIAIARHNFGSNQFPVVIEGSTTNGSSWFELVEEQLLLNDAPAIFQFVSQSLTNIRMLIGPGDDPAELAVLYVGKLLTLQRRIYVGHTPIPFGRTSKIKNGRTENGDFLGRIITSKQVGTSVDLQNITPTWYREEMDPFIEASDDTPFFFAWRPGDYPQEVGFAWMTNDPQPSNQRNNGMMQINLQMAGIGT